jgi:hypothetical protein
MKRIILFCLACFVAGCQSLTPKEVFVPGLVFPRAVVCSRSHEFYPNPWREYQTDVGYLDRKVLSDIFSVKQWTVIPPSARGIVGSPVIIALTESKKQVAFYYADEYKKFQIRIGTDEYETTLTTNEVAEVRRIVDEGRNNVLMRRTTNELKWK